MKIDRDVIFDAEVKADIYQPEGNPPKKYFHAYAQGDKDASKDEQDIIFRVNQLPPGARITLSYPSCPECGFPRMDKIEFKDGGYYITGHESKCECGFDWEEWVMSVYS